VPYSHIRHNIAMGRNATSSERVTLSYDGTGAAKCRATHNAAYAANTRRACMTNISNSWRDALCSITSLPHALVVPSNGDMAHRAAAADSRTSAQHIYRVAAHGIIATMVTNVFNMARRDAADMPQMALRAWRMAATKQMPAGVRIYLCYGSSSGI